MESKYGTAIRAWEGEKILSAATASRLHAQCEMLGAQLNMLAQEDDGSSEQTQRLQHIINHYKKTEGQYQEEIAGLLQDLEEREALLLPEEEEEDDDYSEDSKDSQGTGSFPFSIFCFFSIHPNFFTHAL